MGENVLNHPIKLIALDMDGTLLNDDHEVSEANRKAIKAAEEKGVHVILSTGRPYATCSDYAKSLELSSYLITVNGSEVYDEQAQLIQQQMINTEHIQWMYEISKTYKTGFWAISLEQVYREEMPEDIAASKWLKFGFDIQDDHVRAKVLDLLQTKKDLEISNSRPTNIEVNGLGVNKAKAIAFVGERLGITMDEVMAVGDSLNDLAMIKEAGLGVAMGNAQDIVKKTANWVTTSNQEDGVAKAIEKWVLSS